MKTEAKRVLWAVKIGDPSWAEQLITDKEENIEPAKEWASANGFDRFRIAVIDNEKPDFTKTLNKY